MSLLVLPETETPSMHIEIVLALQKQQHLFSINLESAITLEHLINHLSNYLPVPLPSEFNRHDVGIFGKKQPLSTLLQDGDRVEFYRPLIIDPKTRRRTRALLQKKKRKRDM